MTATQRVWITGASSGLGAALAREYAQHGAQVLLTARPSERLDAIVAELGPAARACPADVTDADQLAAAVDALLADGGPPDLAIFNAGTYTPMGLDDLDSDAIARLFALNVFAVARGIELLAPHLRRAGRGHVAVVGSVAGDIGLPYAGAYSASKAALERLCQSLRPEFDRAGLTLSLIAPGFVRTPLTDRNDFPMPFLIEADAAARIVRRKLARGRFEIRFPLAMSLTMRLLAALPNALSTRLTRAMLRS